MVKSGSVTSIDGCPYKLWKTIDKHFEVAKSKEKEGFISKTTNLLSELIVLNCA
jgi:hypothetical protein